MIPSIKSFYKCCLLFENFPTISFYQHKKITVRILFNRKEKRLCIGKNYYYYYYTGGEGMEKENQVQTSKQRMFPIDKKTYNFRDAAQIVVF